MSIVMGILGGLAIMWLVIRTSIWMSDRKVMARNAGASAGVAAELNLHNHHGGDLQSDSGDGGGD